VIDEIQPAILQRAAVGFDLSKSQRSKKPRYFLLIWTTLDTDHLVFRPRTLLLEARSSKGNPHTAQCVRLLLYTQNGILCRLRDREFNDHLWQAMNPGRLGNV